jgi:hypothetical protein
MILSTYGFCQGDFLAVTTCPYQVATGQGHVVEEVGILSGKPLAAGPVSSLAGDPATDRLMRRQERRRGPKETGGTVPEDSEPRKDRSGERPRVFGSSQATSRPAHQGEQVGTPRGLRSVRASHDDGMATRETHRYARREARIREQA